MRTFWLSAILAFSVLVAGCGAGHHAEATQAAPEGDRTTLGNVQRNIRKGMTTTDVLEVMGSPNIVTSGDNGSETWVYDKIATDTVHSDSGAYWFVVGSGGEGGSGASSVSQRTLTVIIKFEQQKVADLAYHSSRF